ncbi:glutathione S-transferase C-terminal-like protein [Scleroderma citrinum]
MAPIGKLYGHPRQPQTIAILSAAVIGGLEIECPPVEFGVTNKSPEFLAKFPQGKIAAFEDNEGFKLTESAVIARYVSTLAPGSGLLGRNPKETILVDQWVHFAEFEIIVSTGFIYAGTVMKVLKGFNAEQHEFHAQRVCRTLQFLEDYLATRPSGLLINDSITLADIFVAAAVVRAGETVCGVAEREQTYPHVFAHYAKVSSDERIKAVFAQGNPKFVEKPLVFQAE